MLSRNFIIRSPLLTNYQTKFFVRPRPRAFVPSITDYLRCGRRAVRRRQTGCPSIMCAARRETSGRRWRRFHMSGLLGRRRPTRTCPASAWWRWKQLLRAAKGWHLQRQPHRQPGAVLPAQRGCGAGGARRARGRSEAEKMRRSAVTSLFQTDKMKHL